MNIVTRIAPSPTGYMHIGSLRTALYNYFYAKKYGGKFLLRVENTDRTRYVEGSVEALIRMFDRMGLVYDEGPVMENNVIIEKGDHGPYFQSERLPLYRTYAKQLIDQGAAYYCFCSADRLKSLRETQQISKLPTKYDRHCKSLSAEEIQSRLDANEAHVIRLFIPEGSTMFHDEIRGDIRIENKEVDDQVLMKSDGFPTYHLAVVVDDHLMNVTHVIRAEEWISSAPKHIILYQLFGWELPIYAHLPLILNKDRSKLSKRQGDVAVEDFLDKGYLPEAIINYISLLGFNPSGEKEIYSLQELIDGFDLSRVNKGGAIFDVEKLNWVNGEYLKQKSLEELIKLAKPFLDKSGIQVDDVLYQKILTVEKDRLQTLGQIPEVVKEYIEVLEFAIELIVWKKADKEDAKKQLTGIRDFITSSKDEIFSHLDLIEVAIKEYISGNELQNGNVLWPTRVALSGKEKSPSPFELLWILGKEESVKRLDAALNRLS